MLPIDAERFQALVETSQEGVSIIMPDGKSVYQSPAVERLLGWTREEATRLTWQDFIHVDDRPLLAVLLMELVAKPGTTKTLECRLKHRSGEVLYGRMDMANHLMDSRIGGFVVRFRESTEEKITTERYRLLFTRSPLPMYFFDAQTRLFIDVNDAVSGLYGYTREELLTMTVEQLADVDEHLDIRALTAEMRERGQSLVIRRRHRTKMGKPIDVEVTAHTVDAGTKAILSVVNDRTQRLKLEAQLLQAQKMEAIGGLAGGVAHDFNNLATIILSYTSAMLEELRPDDPLRADIREVHAAGERARALTRQLLTFSGKQTVHEQVVDLHYVVASMRSMLARLLPENITFLLEGSRGRTPVLADPTHIEQITLNLVVNARDAMPDGGTLKMSTDRIALDQRQSAETASILPGTYALLRVSDTGTGMSEKVRDRIFEPFFTTKGRDKGTGLGLSTVFGLVQQSQGVILVDSKPGAGTTFSVYLPVSSND